MYPEFDRLLSFASIHHALRAEKLVGEAGIKAAAVPTPREVDISCGQSLLFAANDQQAILALLDTGHVRWSKLFCRHYAAKSYEKLADWEDRVC